MIQIKKDTNAIPPSLVGLGKKEMEKAVADFLHSGKVSTKFSAYSKTDVKDALIALFHSKCAYCESKFMITSPGAVEHFRPKGRNKIKYKEPDETYVGYYWLAANWDNLLLSCTDCNSERKHAVPGEPRKISIGKQDKFPLVDELKRCKRHDGNYQKNFKLEEKARLLVNPCSENPEQFFDFDEDGFIKVAAGLKGIRLRRSEESIKVYALHRQELVDARKEHFLKLIGEKFIDITRLLKKIEQLQAAPVLVKDLQEELDEKVHKLLLLTLPDQPYSAMAKKLIKKGFKERFPALLKKYGIEAG